MITISLVHCVLFLRSAPYARKNYCLSMTTFKELIRDIGDALGATSGLDSEEVDHQELISLMERYSSDKTEWLSYAFSDASRNYTRNQVSDTNKKSNVLVIVWVCQTRHAAIAMLADLNIGARQR